MDEMGLLGAIASMLTISRLWALGTRRRDGWDGATMVQRGEEFRYRFPGFVFAVADVRELEQRYSSKGVEVHVEGSGGRLVFQDVHEDLSRG